VPKLPNSQLISAGQAVARDLAEGGYTYVQSDNPSGSYIVAPDEVITQETPQALTFAYSLGSFASKGFFRELYSVGQNAFAHAVIEAMEREFRILEGSTA